MRHRRAGRGRGCHRQDRPFLLGPGVAAGGVPQRRRGTGGTVRRRSTGCG
ncbi:hypothetical protein SLI_0519 [Streptomyces lividans 1326]|uniref:Uncharacterized protein n=1 Tax=Streptomyces lividans 1326 TaxID=1200984 RepID=A0A7U9H8D2_STRLI|nr:hypothetical protein SLI_0519 [Streptomyces lividans 1326]